jgi:rhodanese-related sulfurtransferase
MVAQIRVEDLQQRLQTGEKILLLDVRNENEYQYCHLADSQLIPLPELMQRVDEVETPKDHPVVVYCHHGIRSLSGAAILQQFGFTNVSSLHGGIEAWSLRVDPSVPRY